MAYCDQCGNFDKSHAEYTDETTESQDYQPDLYYYWDSPIEEDYDWRDALPDTNVYARFVLISTIMKVILNGKFNCFDLLTKH